MKYYDSQIITVSYLVMILVFVCLKGGIGLNVAQMIVELIRDKRKIVDRITKNNIDTFLQLLRTNQV